MCVCVRACVRVRVFMRACDLAFAHACVRVSVIVFVCTCMCVCVFLKITTNML